MNRIRASVALGAILASSAVLPRLVLAEIVPSNPPGRNVAEVAFQGLALASQPCRPTTASDARAAVERAIGAIGLSSVGDGVRTSIATEVQYMAYQSDRMYPPYLWTSRELRLAMDWRRGLHRAEQGTPPNTVAFVSDSSRRAATSPRGAMLMPRRQPPLVDERAMDPWAVLADWREASDVRVVEECLYREYWRTVLGRSTPEGAERLFLDPKTGIPIKLERRESHYLWGSVNAEYLWSIWSPVKGSRAIAPQFAFRLADGETEEQRVMLRYAVVARDSAGALTIPPDATPAPIPASTTPDTVRVSPTTFLLVTRAFTNVVSLQRDTVFIFDAQTSAERAQRDSVWIGKLFPGQHPVVLVVTDLAWPHIAGVRYWVAQGATIVSHSESRAFLQRVLDRTWTAQPDELEQRRASMRFTFRPVTASLALAGGDIQLRPIDGVGSEGALMAYLPNERFLYAGDYIQGGGPESFTAIYARDVAEAVRRAGFQPERFAAMHMPLSAWSSLARLVLPP